MLTLVERHWRRGDESGYATALDEFDEVIESGQHVADTFAGRAVTALAASEDSLAVASAESTPARNPEYEFGRRQGFNWRDLRLVMAQAFPGTHTVVPLHEGPSRIDR